MDHTRITTAALRILRLVVPVLIGACGALPMTTLPLSGLWLALPAPDTLIAVVAADDASDYGRGALLGVEEGRRSAELLRSSLRLEPFEYETTSDPRALVRRLVAEGTMAVVAALPQPAQDELERAAMAEGVVVLDARPAHPSESAERPNVFRIGVPSSTHPGGRGEKPAAVLWHPDLFRYGAEQLNERYRRRFDGGMTAEAWAGWMAVKAATEASLRARGRELRAVLADPQMAFDGHKGRPLAFDGPGRTLAQPLYLVDGQDSEEIRWPKERIP
jgi:ABC-type branched-subunit amino acid transport system substrate-binding protein